MRQTARISIGADIDAVIDFDAAVRDPQWPTRLLPACDSGDHLHLQNNGYAAMAAHVDLAELLAPEIALKVKGKTPIFWEKKTFTVRISARTSH